MGDWSSVEAWLALRFRDVNAEGDIISATLKVYVDGLDDPEGTFYTDDVSDSALLGTANNDIIGRSLSSNSVTWSGTNLGNGFVDIDVTGLVEERVEQDISWASGNAITFIGVPDSTSNKQVNIEGRNNSNGTGNHATLTIVYDPP